MCVCIETLFSRGITAIRLLFTDTCSSHTHAAASSARLVLAQHFGYAIKAQELIAQQNNSPRLIPV